MYIVKKIGRTSYVLSDTKRITKEIKRENFCGTGLALAGILKENETLEQWKDRVYKVRMELLINANK